MLRTITGAACALLVAAIAIAAGEVPARYAGAFPSFGNFTSVTATFAAPRLLLKATLAVRGRFTPVSGEFTCTQTAPTQTRCPGRFRGEGTGSGAPGVLTVTWKGGVPIEATYVKN